MKTKILSFAIVALFIMAPVAYAQEKDTIFTKFFKFFKKEPPAFVEPERATFVIEEQKKDITQEIIVDNLDDTELRRFAPPTGWQTNDREFFAVWKRIENSKKYGEGVQYTLSNQKLLELHVTDWSDPLCLIFANGKLLKAEVGICRDNSNVKTVKVTQNQILDYLTAVQVCRKL